MKTEKFQIWIQGYAATGESQSAERLLRKGQADSTWEAISFEQACVKALNELKWTMLYEEPQGLGSCHYDPQANAYWGRRFFNNETDARKPFG